MRDSYRHEKICRGKGLLLHSNATRHKGIHLLTPLHFCDCKNLSFAQLFPIVQRCAGFAVTESTQKPNSAYTVGSAYLLSCAQSPKILCSLGHCPVEELDFDPFWVTFADSDVHKYLDVLLQPLCILKPAQGWRSTIHSEIQIHWIHRIFQSRGAWSRSVSFKCWEIHSCHGAPKLQGQACTICLYHHAGC